MLTLALFAACKPATDPPTPADTAVEDTDRGPTLTVALVGAGSGRVVSTPAGIDCPGTCEVELPSGTEVQLEVQPDADAWFAGFTGDCAGFDPSCTVVLDADRTVTVEVSEPRVDWVQRWGAGAAESTQHLAVRDDGSSVWTCAESGNVPTDYDVGFGPQPLPTDAVLACVVSVDPSGTPEWSHVWTHDVDGTLAVDMAPNGDVVVALLANTGFSPASGEPEVSLQADGQLVLARYDRLGAVSWVRAFPYFDNGIQLSVSDTHVFLWGDVYAGDTWGTLAPPVGDSQLVALDSQGEPLWVRGFPGFGWDLEAVSDSAVVAHYAASGAVLEELDATGARWRTPFTPTSELVLRRGPTGNLLLMLRGDPYATAPEPFEVGALSTTLDPRWHVVHLLADGTPRSVFALDDVFPELTSLDEPAIAAGPPPWEVVVWSPSHDTVLQDRRVVAFGATGGGVPIWSLRFDYTESNARVGQLGVTADGAIIASGSTSFDADLDLGTGPVGSSSQPYDPWLVRIAP